MESNWTVLEKLLSTTRLLPDELPVEIIWCVENDPIKSIQTVCGHSLKSWKTDNRSSIFVLSKFLALNHATLNKLISHTFCLIVRTTNHMIDFLTMTQDMGWTSFKKELMIEWYYQKVLDVDFPHNIDVDGNKNFTWHKELFWSIKNQEVPTHKENIIEKVFSEFS